MSLLRGRSVRAGRGMRRGGRYAVEALEGRAMLAANIHLNSVSIVDIGGNPIPNVVIGTNVYVRVSFTTTDLPAGASYTISRTIYGRTLTATINYGAGLSGTHSYSHYWGTWTINHSASPVATATMDSTGAVAESNESDNAGSFAFTPVQMPLPAKFTQPLAGVAFRDYGYNNYTDRGASTAVADYRGGPYTYDGHDAIDMSFPSFKAMDDGTPVLAVAAGTVVDADDGNFDRNTAGSSLPANSVVIDHGNGWRTYYWHLRQGSVGVKTGQAVVAGQVIGLVGSSGNSTGTHLHFAVYNGDVVETYADPQAYWQDPLPYQGDVSAVIDSGVTNYNPTGFLDTDERPPEYHTFAASAGEHAYAWFRSFIPGSAPATITFYRPNGTVFQTANFTANLSRNGYYWAGYPLPSPAPAGTWQAVFVVGGVELGRESFVVNAAGSPGATVNYGSTFIPDGRTTSIDGGTWAQGAAATPLVFTAKNYGKAALALGAVTPPPGWLVVDPLVASLAPGATDTFSLVPDTSVPGTMYGFASFTTNDPLAPVFDFALAAFVDPQGATNAVTLYSRDAVAGETGRDPAVFRIARRGPTTAALTVNLSWSGTATSGADFVALPATVTIPAGETAVSLALTPIDDAEAGEGTETLTLSLAASAAYTIGQNASVTATIADNDGAGTAAIAGTIYLDRNFNSYRDAGEVGLAGYGMFLDLNADDVRQAGEPMATTDGAGNYSFPSLLPGRYAVRAVDRSGYIISSPVGWWTVRTGETVTLNLGAFPIAFAGTEGADTFAIAAGSKPARVQITAGGVTYDGLRSQLPRLTFAAAGGHDVLNVDRALLGPAPGVLSAVPVTFAGDAGTGDRLRLTGLQAADAVSVEAGRVLIGPTVITWSGGEEVLLDAAGAGAINLAALKILAGTALLPADIERAVSVAELEVAAGARLDLGKATLTVTAATEASTSAIRAAVAAASAGGRWTGPGIFSSAAAGDANRLSGVGYSSAGGQVTLRATVYGDANLDGSVSADDVAVMLAAQAGGQTDWSAGNFNYDGRISSDDWALFAQGAALAGPAVQSAAATFAREPVERVADEVLA